MAAAFALAAGAAGVRAADAPSAQTTSPRAGKNHWAFQPVHKSEPPAGDDAWCINDIDRFIFARLRENRLTPVPAADKGTLIRRATLDLIGLPPTPEEVDAFLKDGRPDAFARVVDRLLDSPHYGERWGRYWLDLARYADDEGNSFLTPSPNAYIYRDWVIRAFNKDMPYNQFLRLQLAGDLIPEPTDDYVERLGGLGFQGLGPTFRKGAAGEAKAKADELEDRVDTLSRGILALTISCARCHDHKFDPIPTRDYYSLAAAYNGATWAPRILASPDIVEAVNKKEKDAADLKAKVEKWPGEEGKKIGRQELARLDAYLIAGWQIRAQRLRKLHPDEAALAHEANLRPYFLTRVVKFLDSDRQIPALAAFAQWRAAAEQAAQSADVNDGSVIVPAPLLELTGKLGADALSVLNALKSQEEKPKDGPDKPAPLDDGQKALLKAFWQDGDAPFAVAANDVPPLLSDAARKELEAKKVELQRLTSTSPSDPARCPSVSGGGEAMHVFIRGNPEQAGEAAPPGFLGILRQDGGAAAGEHFTRLDLADAIIDPKNPLTARVIVNRVWHYHFGRGIVGTLGNFGARGDPPTHPELLDTLAARFMESGWSIKWLHRQMMLSATYQLGGASDPDNLAKDADNHYLWRYSTRRLDVEAWRDVMLAVSGKLDRKMGGPALDPKEPGEKIADFPAFVRLRGLLADDPANGRRTVYCIVSRYAPNLTLTMFDFPEPNVASDHRNVTTIPQQQLFVLNSPFMLAVSKAFAARVTAAETSDPARLELAWRLAYGRAITPAEADRCRDFLGVSAQASDSLSPWEQLCQAILAGNELAFLP
ncbi:MAG TPA: DUF1549 and DUF1553 domain-containing protein [Tepidisphaeraceae bacterium]|jgi:hypothetical protein|nr:DUF1549 and DUF1553 domain-containing protein [Tepidisphaeraceae bacterium]